MSTGRCRQRRNGCRLSSARRAPDKNRDVCRKRRTNNFKLRFHKSPFRNRPKCRLRESLSFGSICELNRRRYPARWHGGSTQHHNYLRITLFWPGSIPVSNDHDQRGLYLLKCPPKIRSTATTKG